MQQRTTSTESSVGSNNSPARSKDKEVILEHTYYRSSDLSSFTDQSVGWVMCGREAERVQRVRVQYTSMKPFSDENTI